MRTNTAILIVTALFFVYLLVAIHREEKRTADRRERDLGPPDGTERRAGQPRRKDSLGSYLRWALRSQSKKVTRLTGGGPS